MEPGSSTTYAVVFGFGVALLAFAMTGSHVAVSDPETSRSELVVRCSGQRACVDAVVRHFDACYAEVAQEPTQGPTGPTDSLAACIIRRSDGRISLNP